MQTLSNKKWIVLLCLIFLVGACSNPPPVLVVADFRIELDTSNLTVKQGNEATIEITISKTSTFNETVRLSVDSLPKGISASLSPEAAIEKSILTLKVDNKSNPDEYTFMLKGIAGDLERQTNVQLIVQANAPKLPEPPKDTSPPQITSIQSTSNTTVELSFNEAVKQADIKDNYSIDPEIAVVSANVSIDNRTITLTTSRQSKGVTYLLNISENITDLAGNAYVPVSNPALAPSFVGIGQVTGALTINILGLPKSVPANIEISGPDGFNQTVTSSTLIDKISSGEYQLTINTVKAQSATFEGAEPSRSIRFDATVGSNINLNYNCTSVNPPDIQLSSVFERATGKATYNCQDLANLESLDAALEGIKDLAGLQYATGLKSLSLYYNDIQNLPQGLLNSLINLTSIDLGSNLIEVIPAGYFDNQVNLTYLDLSDNKLSSLPDDIFTSLSSLITLNLYYNQLTNLPEKALEKLLKLEHLDLEGNLLSSFPDGINALALLTYLNLGDNSISELPVNVFDQLSALQFLALFSNEINSLPEGIFSKLTSLQALSLYDNQIQAIPETTFDTLSGLVTLDLGANQINNLSGNQFETLVNLETLQLDTNKLTQVPNELFISTSSLQVLNLDDNLLSHLAKSSFDAPPSLKELGLESNCFRPEKVPTKGFLATLKDRVENFRSSNNPKEECPTFTQLPTSSEFDHDTEGWTVTEDGENLKHVESGGNPGGYIQATDGDPDDTALNTIWYWKAPSLYYGDASDYVGKLLRFSLIQSGPNSPFDAPDVILKNNEGTSLTTSIDSPGLEFEEYIIRLEPEVFTPVLPLTDFIQFFRNLDSLEIRGEYLRGADVGGLDSVHFGDEINANSNP